jgi:hypothetical protein
MILIAKSCIHSQANTKERKKGTSSSSHVSLCDGIKTIERTSTSRGQQLSKLGMTPTNPPHSSSCRNPLILINTIAISISAKFTTYPHAITIQIPNSNGFISRCGGEATSVIVEGDVVDVVEMTVGEDLGGGDETVGFGGGVGVGGGGGGAGGWAASGCHGADEISM